MKNRLTYSAFAVLAIFWLFHGCTDSLGQPRITEMQLKEGQPKIGAKVNADIIGENFNVAFYRNMDCFGKRLAVEMDDTYSGKFVFSSADSKDNPYTISITSVFWQGPNKLSVSFEIPIDAQTGKYDVEIWDPFDTKIVGKNILEILGSDSDSDTDTDSDGDSDSDSDSDTDTDSDTGTDSDTDQSLCEQAKIWIPDIVCCPEKVDEKSICSELTEEEQTIGCCMNDLSKAIICDGASLKQAVECKGDVGSMCSLVQWRDTHACIKYTCQTPKNSYIFKDDNTYNDNVIWDTGGNPEYQFSFGVTFYPKRDNPNTCGTAGRDVWYQVTLPPGSAVDITTETTGGEVIIQKMAETSCDSTPLTCESSGKPGQPLTIENTTAGDVMSYIVVSEVEVETTRQSKTTTTFTRTK